MTEEEVRKIRKRAERCARKDRYGMHCTCCPDTLKVLAALDACRRENRYEKKPTDHGPETA